ncbi:MAG: capsular polysaccharide biosynthesis protein [Comamonas sp.]|jgi:capsular polysaccharide export protein|uniref:capsular polysaccharide biosynthesis protein n=1 Tax=Comamonas sp. TaxID=34028 RepID=UPI00281D9904|nr:capsular polysaccharide biosynthesis protein [Comamonas sp.]MDR0215262.1 capsular polysaccharide biosynthesis protein [Comamonas sp.]
MAAGWGLRPSTRKALAYASKHGLPYVALEDGFLRSFGTGEHFPPLSLVIDDKGIYYDCTRPSALERLLSSDTDLLAPDAVRVQQAREELLSAGLSKYNHAPDLPEGMLRSGDVQRVLVVDQTAGDMSVAKGGADAATFEAMLAAALAENPQATIYVKTHPEVTSGRKGGYLTRVQPGTRMVVLREAVNPMSLIAQMDKVYVVSSTMGFEALLANKPVVCFGVPWYAGWGVTDDRQPQHPAMGRRAGRGRSVNELFAAGYMHYTRYLNPETQQLGSIDDVMQWLERQREMAQRFAGRMICVGFPRWRAWNFRQMLSLHTERVVYVRNAGAAAALKPERDDCLLCWGRVPPEGVQELAGAAGVRLLRMEDGFVRSVGLGSDLIPPQSFVLDAKGIYFDPGQPSELEDLLNTRAFTAQDLQRARKVRAFIVKHGITKYNLEPNHPVDWFNDERPQAGRQVVLVPGQVEDDASIRFGCDAEGVSTNLGLIQAARAAFPAAFIVFKPHPDVSSGNRKGYVEMAQALRYADHVEQGASVVSCIDACDVVVTMTSLTGFDALLRGKQVVVHGRPFYAGWGLTQDRLPVPRRSRLLSLDELVAGALLHYPLYWDPVLRGYTSCEAVLRRLLEQRTALEQSGSLHGLKFGWARRQWRKSKVLLQSILSDW